MQDNRTVSPEVGAAFLAAKRRLFDKVYGARLNEQQREAVFTVNGPLLVLAGAGSGKTTVLVNRIVYLIKYGNAYFTDFLPEGVDADTVEALRMAEQLTPSEIEELLPQFIHEPTPPWNVLAFTFTNKAAREIKERLLRTFGDKETAEAVWAGTFHSVCLRILRKYGSRLGLSDGFSIYDTDDKKRMISGCMRDLEIDEKRLAPKAVASAISMEKDNLRRPEDMECGSDPRARDIKAIYELYQRRMLESDAVDFDDIIMMTVELLQGDSEVREYYQRKFRYVLVDEYQDTNHAQFVLTGLLSGGRNNIMVVGDDDQSIYRFRGATVENILSFDRTYPEARVIKLEQNYRSTGNILAAANAVISHNGTRHQKSLWCDKGDGDRITVREAFDQNDEGRYIVDRINRAVKEEGRRYSDHAVLYRVNAMGRTLQSAFIKSGTPFRVLGDMGFYDRKEVKDMIAYLAVLKEDTRDKLRLKRIINEPKRKIGTATVDAVEQLADGLGISMYEVLRRVDEFPVLSKSREKLSSFVELIEGVRRDATLPSEMVRMIFERSGYRDMLVAEGFEGEGRIEFVNEFISAALEYEQRCADAGDPPSLVGFLEEIALVSDVDKYDDNDDTVVLMTIHAAKGLEFPTVFLAGMEDGIFPSEQNIGDEEEMSEERRLCYVAITRAKERLFITYAKNRMMYGRTLWGRLSCFVREELPRELTVQDAPRRIPPRQGSGGYRPSVPQERPVGGYSELRRPPEIGRPVGSTVGVAAGRQTAVKRTGAESFGVERLAPGTRVAHATFGEGVILSCKDMGGDVLYEVKFDSGAQKKLMATYARLKRLQ